MKGFVLINAFNKSDAYLNQPSRLKEEFNKRNVELDILKNDGVRIYIDGDGKIVNGYKGYDFCICLDKDEYVSACLEKCGLRLFNSAEAIRVCDDKYRTYIALTGSGIDMPTTFCAPLCYTNGAEADENALKTIARKLGFPMVVKTNYGSLGASVKLMKNADELIKYANEEKLTPHIYQKFVKGGEDVRIIVIGGKVAAGMKRINRKDFRSNVELGGVGVKYVPSKDETEIAERAAKFLNLDYCGVDVLDDNGSPVLCEVNSNAFFGGIEKVSGVNVAGAYADFIIKAMTGN